MTLTKVREESLLGCEICTAGTRTEFELQLLQFKFHPCLLIFLSGWCRPSCEPRKHPATTGKNKSYCSAATHVQSVMLKKFRFYCAVVAETCSAGPDAVYFVCQQWAETFDAVAPDGPGRETPQDFKFKHTPPKRKPSLFTGHFSPSNIAWKPHIPYSEVLANHR